MEESEKLELLSNLVFSNEVILDKIFSFLPTQDLLLWVSLVNRLWNHVADKMVHHNRIIFLNNANILGYCELVKNRGKSHRHISLDLNCSQELPKLSSAEVDTLIFTFGIIGQYVQQLKLQSSPWDNDSVKQSQSNLFHQLVLQSPNIIDLTLRIPGLNGVDPEQLFYSDGSTLLNLQILTLESVEYSDRMKIMVSFLTHCPNIQKINWGSNETISFKMEDLFRLEQLAPHFFRKLCSLAFEKLDEEMANFLVSKDFRGLRKLVVTAGLELPSLARVLEKYGGQLIHLGLALGDIWKNEEYDGLQIWNFPLIQFPVMENLETLDLSYFGLDGNNPKWPIIKFWECVENSRIFHKLNMFTLYFGPELQQRHIEAILSQTFQFSPIHPIFPSVRNISGSFMGIIKRDNPYLFDMMASYFPNVVVYASLQPIPNLFRRGPI